LTLDFGMVAADTTRTRAYLGAMMRHGLLPAHVLVLKSADAPTLPVQASGSLGCARASDEDWSEADFDIASPLEAILETAGIDYRIAPSCDINDAVAVGCIAERPEHVLVYSGYGGVLLRREVLNTGKRFLHIHGGFLPNYKGSTTNYFSLLADNQMGASAIFLTEDIDCGPILSRRVFPAPGDRAEIDHIYDSAARAKVLIDVLTRYRDSGTWTIERENEGGDTYYVIHPVLKHIAILSEK
jgi:methionyl-tRNA formyltransferase